MNQRRLSILPNLLISTFFIASLVFLSLSPVAAQPYNATPAPLQDYFELSDMQYAYNPETNTLTKTYTFKNISGETILNPLLVNLFLWSNNNSSVNWPAMGYDGAGTYINSDQSASTANNSGLLDWSVSVNPASINSAQLFADLPLQTVQSGTGYPYWSIPGYELQWPDGASATIEVRFSDVLNSNWIQNMVWIVHSIDADNDGITGVDDNCPNLSNPNQEDADGNGTGDVCDEYTIYGTVDPVVVATVEIYTTTCGLSQLVDTTTTDQNGYYAVGGLDSGRHLVVPIASGYSFVPVRSWPVIPQAEIQSYDFTAVAN